MDAPVSSHRYTRRMTTLSGMLLLAVISSASGVQGAVCSQSQQTELASLVDANKAIFLSCTTDLKLSLSPSASSDTLASFITEDYLQDKNADLLCASDHCVRALIRAMENLPDCCTQVASATRNLPRLADDILHQCDVRDAKLLASELEAEIAKLPDLKVQIKSLGTGQGNSVAGSGRLTTVGDDVDVIIDVKKRELMKTGGLGLTPSDGQANSSTTVASVNSAVDVAVSHGVLLIAVVASIVQLGLW